MDANPYRIEDVKLYFQVRRVFNELRARGIAEDARLTPDDTSAFDNLHYLGTETVDEAMRALALGPGRHVLDVGSGLGGPARHMAAKGCRVTALELQPELNATAARLTERCGLSHLVDHVAGDFMAHRVGGAEYDAVASWLVFLHLADRPAAIRRILRALRPGGMVYVEDFFAKAPLAPGEWEALRREVWAHAVPGMEDWRAQFHDAGFVDIRPIDMTARWAPFVKERLAQYRSARARNVGVHGAEVVDALDAFYATMDALFDGGNLGGIRVIARRP